MVTTRSENRQPVATNTAVVVTTIQAPTPALEAIADGCRAHSHALIVVGDTASPSEFRLRGADFYSVSQQIETGFAFAQACPTKHYARKNVGYLIAMSRGATWIVDTDDDNFPLSDFFSPRQRRVEAVILDTPGWVNVYSYFTDENVWPRGFPLDVVRRALSPVPTLRVQPVDSPIQQGLADDNPDVDAIYRLTLPLPVRFKRGPAVALSGRSWCPFNSQNTAWHRDAFPLLYLPAYCPFRLTDIWRSFVAQRIAQENGWSIMFHAPSMRQERNEHSLLADFANEVPGYLNNGRLMEALAALPLSQGQENIAGNLKRCYETFIAMQLIDERELDLLAQWLSDLADLS